MSRFFFDVTGNGPISLDYAGKMLSGLDEARSYAELLALDIGIGTDWRPTIQVRDVAGQLLLSVSGGAQATKIRNNFSIGPNCLRDMFA